MSEFLEYNWRSNISSTPVGGVFKYWDPKDRIEALKCLRELIRSSNDYELKTHMPQDDTTLLKFLYARKFDLEESFTLLKNYFWYRKRNPEIFQNLTLEAEDIEKALENSLPGVLGQKDRKGRSVLVFTGSNWDCSYGLLGIYRALLFSLEHLIEHVHNQTNGFVVIVDWTEFTFRQSTYLKPSILKLMIEGLQDCFPARFKGIHFINQPWYVEAALSVFKWLLIDKVKDRIFVHGNNLSTLHEHVHKDILPAELGGEQPSYNPSSFLDTLRKSASKK